MQKKWNQIKQAIPNANIVEIDCGTNAQGTPDYLKSAEATEIIHLLKIKTYLIIDHEYLG